MEDLENKLFNKKKSGWLEIENEEGSKIFSFCEGYMDYLNKAKTEREFIAEAKKKAEENGFKDLNVFSSNRKTTNRKWTSYSRCTCGFAKT